MKAKEVLHRFPAETQETPLESILEQWRAGLRISHKAHFRCATSYEKKSLALGIPVVILSAVAGTAVFATLESTPDIWARILIGLISVLAAVLSSLQTFLRLTEAAERHKTAAVKYGTLRREIEEILSDPSKYSPAKVAAIRERWNACELESPVLPTKVYLKVQKEVEAKRLSTRTPLIARTAEQQASGF